jgi:hypothetical protein
MKTCRHIQKQTSRGTRHGWSIGSSSALLAYAFAAAAAFC